MSLNIYIPEFGIAEVNYIYLDLSGHWGDSSRDSGLFNYKKEWTVIYLEIQWNNDVFYRISYSVGFPDRISLYIKHFLNYVESKHLITNWL